MSAVLAGYAPDDPMLVRMAGGAPMVATAARCMGAAATLAGALPPVRYAIQCCTDTLDLAISTLAAWRAGQTVVMPATRLAADVDALRARFPDHYVLDAAQLQRLLAGAAERAADPVAALLASADAVWPPFDLDALFEAVVLFTSGTTSAPRAHAKTWDALMRGAQTFGRAYPAITQRPLLVGTVDCHHMFGLEANLMAALRCGYPLCTDRPQFPADVQSLLAEVRLRALGPLWLVTTPMQLATFHSALRALADGPERVIVATMPMQPALAKAVEHDWGCDVGEIFGNTELGVMATRRPALDVAYTPAPGMEFIFAADEAVAVARRPDAAMLLDDRVQPVPGHAAGAFMLLGRRSDMIKVAGKRATLTALDAHLRAVPGVVDAAFVMGAHGRLQAAVVAPGVTRRALIDALGERIDAAFMPRPLVQLAGLPRDANGKLPRAALVECIARAMATAAPAADTLAHATTSANAAPATPAPAPVAAPEPVAAPAPVAAPVPERGTLLREHVFAATHPTFAGHFPGDPVVPGALLLAEVEALLLAHGHAVHVCEQAKFLKSVRPGERCTLRVDCTGLPRAPFEIAVGGSVRARGLLQCSMLPAPPQ